jgi:predicted dehydrogenase
MVVVGTEKMLVYDDVDSSHHIQIYDKSVAVEFQSGSADFSDFRTRIRAGDLVVPNIRLVEPLSIEIEHFVQCIERGQTPRTDGTHGLRVVATLEAMSQSMANAGAAMRVGYDGQADATLRHKPVLDIAQTTVSSACGSQTSPLSV